MNPAVAVTCRRNLLAIRLSGETSDCLHEKQTCSSESSRAVLIPVNTTMMESLNFFFHPHYIWLTCRKRGSKTRFYFLLTLIQSAADFFSGSAQLAAFVIGTDRTATTGPGQVMATPNRRMTKWVQRLTFITVAVATAGYDNGVRHQIIANGTQQFVRNGIGIVLRWRLLTRHKWGALLLSLRIGFPARTSDLSFRHQLTSCRPIKIATLIYPNNGEIHSHTQNKEDLISLKVPY